MLLLWHIDLIIALLLHLLVSFWIEELFIRHQTTTLLKFELVKVECLFRLTSRFVILSHHLICDSVVLSNFIN